MEPQSQPETIIDTTKEHCIHQHNRKEIADELIILRALYLSQRRAEEAEEKMLVANQEREKIAKLVIELSAEVTAYKNWEKLIEMDSTQLKRTKGGMRSRDEKRVDGETNSWALGLLLLGFVGAGFIIGRNMW